MGKYSNNGNVVISIDFEMRWGVHDFYGSNIDSYRKNLENSRPAVISTLKMFKERNINATWATVGALGLNNWDEFFNYNIVTPNYSNKKFKVLDSYSKIDPNGLLHFAPDLIKQIIDTNGQELGSHSFSHLYFREEGITKSDFIRDSILVKTLFEKKFNTNPVSIVFPRNQINFLDCFSDLGLMTYRSNPRSYSYNKLHNKLINSYKILSPFISGPFNYESNHSTGNIFIRFNLPKVLWNLQLLKIKNTLKNLNNNEVFHIWWHPHNVGSNLKHGLNRFEQLFDLIANEIDFNNLNSCSMKDLFLKRSNITSK